MRQGIRSVLTVLALAPGLAAAQVSGKSTGQCYFGDERGWVSCDAGPLGNSSSGTVSSGPSAEQLRQQRMLDAAGELGAAIGAAIGRQLSGEASRDKALGLNNDAIAAAGRGEWHTARSLTLKALRLVPDDPTLKQNLAVCDREIAEAERLTAVRKANEERARREAQQRAAAQQAEEIARNLQGQLKTGGEGGGESLAFKLGEDEPVAVASAAQPAEENPLGFKLSKAEQAELRDTPNSSKPWQPVPVKEEDLGQLDDKYYHYRVTNLGTVTTKPRACVRRDNGWVNRLEFPEPTLKPGQFKDFVYDQGEVIRVTTDGSDPCVSVSRK